MGSDWWGTFCASSRNQYIYLIYQKVKVLHCFAILIRKGVTSSSAFMMRRWGRDGAHASKCTGRVQEASRGAVCDLWMHFALQYFHCRCILHNAVGALVSFAPRHFTAGAVCTYRCTSSAATILRILSSERKTILVLAIPQAHRRVKSFEKQSGHICYWHISVRFKY